MPSPARGSPFHSLDGEVQLVAGLIKSRHWNGAGVPGTTTDIRRVCIRLLVALGVFLGDEQASVGGIRRASGTHLVSVGGISS